ncbi:MAG: sigma-70 family RNA polymerase sigma factor [Acidobacteriota bacterium]
MSTWDGEPTSLVLLARYQHGDEAAREELLARYLPKLRRFAHGRLNGHARDAQDTQDLVQEALLKSFPKLEDFDASNGVTFFPYLTRTICHLARDWNRRERRRSVLEEILPVREPSPLDLLIQEDGFERLCEELDMLEPRQSEAIVARDLLDFSWREVAQHLEFGTEDAARMAVKRAKKALVKRLEDDA